MEKLLTLEPLHNGAHGLRLIGELDMSTVPDLQSALAATSANGQVRLDLSELTFLDSCGLHAIVEYARSTNGGVPVILANPSDAVVRILEITGMPGHPQLKVESNGNGK